MSASLYVHLPFCKQKCFYCSFVVAISKEQHIDRYIECLNSEMKMYDRQKISTIYFGGGTPSRLSILQMKKLKENIEESFDISRISEWTVEVNPEDSDLDYLSKLKEIGINRISLGVQSFNDKILNYLGRNHSGKRALEAYQVISQAGFENISIDLIFSMPNQVEKDILHDLDKIKKLNPEHVSLYGLSIEEDSRFYTKRVVLPSSDIQRKQYLLIYHYLEEAGWHQYEISNFAKVGKESDHNKNYWLGSDYIGLGVGAHSFYNRKRYANVKRLVSYMENVEKGHQIFEEENCLSEHEYLLDRLIFGLRMNAGINLLELQNEVGMALDAQRQEIVNYFVTQGFLNYNKDILKTTLKGRLVLDEISARII